MKKILIISPVPTHPTYAGNRTCIQSYSELLRNLGYHVNFLLIADNQINTTEIEQTKIYWKENFFCYKKSYFHRLYEYIIKYYRFERTGYYNIDDLFPIGLINFIKQIQRANKFDCFIINYIFLTKICKHFKGVKMLLYTHDVFTNKYQRTGLKWFSVTPQDESIALNRANTILSIQENESLYFNYLTLNKILTTYTSFQIYNTPFIGNKTLLYLSGPNNHNLESLEIFYKTIFLKILKNHKDLKLIVGGEICNHLDRKFIHENVQLYGNVNILSDFYKLGDIFINPTFRGTGLKIKNFEAMAYGKILICHPHTTDGIFDKNKAPVLTASTFEDYNMLLNFLFKNKDIALKLKEESINYISRLNDKVKNSFIEAIET